MASSAALSATATTVVWERIDDRLRQTLADARAARGWAWEDVARALRKRGWDITAGNLMVRNSRMSFRADELVLLLDVLGVDCLPIDKTSAARTSGKTGAGRS